MADGAIASAQLAIRADPQALSYEITLDGIEAETRRFVSSDLFEAMIELRKVLESKGARLLCAGARPEVFPSGMARDMGGGRKAYVTRIGEPARSEDLVDIFHYAAPGTVGTVDEQADFHANWVESLSGR